MFSPFGLEGRRPPAVAFASQVAKHSKAMRTTTKKNDAAVEPLKKTRTSDCNTTKIPSKIPKFNKKNQRTRINQPEYHPKFNKTSASLRILHKQYPKTFPSPPKTRWLWLRGIFSPKKPVAKRKNMLSKTKGCGSKIPGT